MSDLTAPDGSHRHARLRVFNVIFDDRYSGPANRVIRVARDLAVHGVETTFCIPEGAGNAGEMALEADVAVRRVRFSRIPPPDKPGRVLEWLSRLPGDVRRFARLFRDERPDAVHVNGAFFAAPAFAAKLAGVPLVWHLNDTVVPGRFAPVFGLLVRALADRVVVSARSVASHYGVDSGSYEVIYAPADMRLFAEAAMNRSHGAGDPARIGLVANWNPLKGHEHFVRAAAIARDRLREEGRELEVVFAGARLDTHADYARRVDTLIDELNLRGAVRDHGFVKDVAPVLGGLDVVVSSSNSEAAPTVVAEAMAAGTPVVVTNVGGSWEMVGDSDIPAGVVVPPRNPEALAEGILSLLRDPEKARRMGENGRRLAGERFSLEASVEKHLEVYRGLARRGADGRGRITFVDQFYYPDASAIAQLLSELTAGLKERGWEVETVTSRDEYAKPERPAPLDPEKAGVQVWRAPQLFGGQARSAKLLRQLWFYLAATARLLSSPAPDIYVAQTTPPLTPASVAVAAALRRRPYAIIAQDLYPEIVAAHGMMSADSPLYRALRGLMDRTYRGAEAVVSLGPHMSRRLREKGVRETRIEEISNWGVGELSPWEGPNGLRREWDLEDRFVVLYSGNIGLGHEFETFLEGAALAREELPELAAVFVGSGARRGEIEALAGSMGAREWVQFRPYQPQDRLRESLGVADLSLVTMREGWEGLLVPSKILGILAVGSPTLYVGPESDISELVERFGAGIHVRSGDVEGVRDAILRAARDRYWRERAGENARRGYAGHLSREDMIDRYDRLLRGLLAGRDRRFA